MNLRKSVLISPQFLSFLGNKSHESVGHFCPLNRMQQQAFEKIAEMLELQPGSKSIMVISWFCFLWNLPDVYRSILAH
jgi:hypothetical protein